MSATHARDVATPSLLQAELAGRKGAPRIVSVDPRLQQAGVLLARAAASETTVLIQGESGTGKELFARALHVLSSRVDGPFVAINCAAIPETLLESELFGHEKGAFTGAVARKPGRFELAHRGTLFLDEIGELPLLLQAKILRALETRTFERVGGTATISVDVRVVAATNRHLRAAVAAKQYREDLYFRLSAFPITVPPLRERPADVVLLARHFIDTNCASMDRPALRLSPGAIAALERYPWPGNVRELQNCMERTVILTEGTVVEAAHLGLDVDADDAAPAAPFTGFDWGGPLHEVVERAATCAERFKVTSALLAHEGDLVRTAAALHISTDDLAARLRALGLDADPIS